MTSGLLQSAYERAHRPSASGRIPVYSPTRGQCGGSSKSVLPNVNHLEGVKFSAVHKASLPLNESLEDMPVKVKTMLLL